MLKPKKLLLCGMMCVCLSGLAACGTDDNGTDNNQNSVNTESAADNNRTDNTGSTNNTGNGNGVVDDAVDAVEDAGDALTGEDAKQNATGE